MPEKFLILGASSFYGKNFAEYVQGRGHEVIGLSRPEFDLTKYLEPIDECVANDKPDYIVNFASMSLVAESWVEPRLWMDANATGTTDLFRWLQDRREHWRRFVHVSTPEVYGDMDGWQDESCRFNPSTPYAVSRAAGDMMLMAYRRAYNFPAVITRTANIYGPGQGANRIIPLAFEKIGNGERLDLHGGGHTVRSFIHVKDACAGLYLAAKQGSVGQTYHISTNRLTSIKELVTLICRELGKSPRDHIGSQEDRLGKDQTYSMSSDRLRRMGWRDTITLERGIAEYGQGVKSARQVPAR